MRRSLAPSQKGKLSSTVLAGSSSSRGVSERNLSPAGGDEDSITICRMPLFGFLEVPDHLAKQFKVPRGCEVTKKNLELRKIKRLGPSKQFQVLRPGDAVGNIMRKLLPTPAGGEEGEDEECEENQMPTANLPPHEPLVLWRDPLDSENKIEVIPELACKLRPHQREGVQFLFECTMGLRGFDGEGCILADDMGLGKTLMSITALWTLLNQGCVRGESAVRKVMVVCPTSLVGNWDNEIRKWVGDKCPTFAVKTEPKKMIKSFLAHRGKGVLIVSYETQRLYANLFENAMKNAHLLSNNSSTKTIYSPVCDLIICDEAHKLKNAESGLSKSLSVLPAKKRIMLSGTPMQNELAEFYNMVHFCNPNVLGSLAEFRKRYERPILAAREPDALESEVKTAAALQKELSVIVNEFILKRGNILNAQHLPPKLTQYVCCQLTPLQMSLYQRLLSSKEIRHIREGKQTNTLNCIRQMINICSHPKLVLDVYKRKLANNETIDDDLQALVSLIPASTNQPAMPTSSSAVTTANRFSIRNPLSRPLPVPGNTGSSSNDYVDYSQSGKLTVLFRMMQAMRAVRKGERIVVVSNYTSTLDLVESLCKQERWPIVRLDGSVTATKRTQLVTQFNDPSTDSFAFLLSSKAGGCGINLIGANRLVLFDPDWNPAADKQAAGRIWREGQKRRCYIYRFVSTGSIEEKIVQRQLSKEGLADIVDDKEQLNTFSSDELKALFTIAADTESEIHDSLRCNRCSFLQNKQQERLRGRKSKSEKVMCPSQRQACVQFVESLQANAVQEIAHFASRRAGEQGSESVGGHCNGLPACISAIFEDLVHSIAGKSCVHSPLSGESNQSNRASQSVDCPEEVVETTATLTSLTQVSRAQREVFMRLDEEMKHAREQAKKASSSPSDSVPVDISDDERTWIQAAALFPSSYSFFSEFLRLWAEIVPSLLTLTDESSKTPNSSGVNPTAESSPNGNADESKPAGDGEAEVRFVEQEGCPEDTDLKKWSHHLDALSCDDDLFSAALGDDALVSFVFGLEVNFSLLEQRELEMRDEVEKRKEQQRKDLEELNERRRKAKLSPDESTAVEGEESAVDTGDGPDDEVQSTKPDLVPEKKSRKVKKKQESGGEGEDLESPSTKKTKRKKAVDKMDDIKKSSSQKAMKSVVRDDPFASSDEGEQIGACQTSSANNAIVVPGSGQSSSKRTTTGDDFEVLARKSKSGREALGSSQRAAQVASSIASGTGRQRSLGRVDDLPLSMTLDPFFQSDFQRLSKHVRKHSLASIGTFDLLWKLLKNVNNDWRCFFLDPNDSESEIFTRVPGLKAERIGFHVESKDYFAGVPAFVQYLTRQCELNGDESMAGAIAALIAPSTNASNGAIENSSLGSVNIQQVISVDSLRVQQAKVSKQSMLDSSDEESSSIAHVSSTRDTADNLHVKENNNKENELNANRRGTTDSLLTIAVANRGSLLKKGKSVSKLLREIEDDHSDEDMSLHKQVSFEIPVPSQTSTQSSTTADAEIDFSTSWDCPMCTFHNSHCLDLTCRMCGYRRGGSKRKHMAIHG